MFHLNFHINYIYSELQIIILKQKGLRFVSLSDEAQKKNRKRILMLEVSSFWIKTQLFFIHYDTVLSRWSAGNEVSEIFALFERMHQPKNFFSIIQQRALIEQTFSLISFSGFVVCFLLTQLFATEAIKVLFTSNTYNLRTHDRWQLYECFAKLGQCPFRTFSYQFKFFFKSYEIHFTWSKNLRKCFEYNKFGHPLYCDLFIKMEILLKIKIL